MRVSPSLLVVPSVPDAIPLAVHHRHPLPVRFWMARRHTLKNFSHEIGAAASEQDFAEFMDCVFERASYRVLDQDVSPYLAIRFNWHCGQFGRADHAKLRRRAGC